MTTHPFDREEPGRPLSTRDAVRVGDTVRRPWQPWQRPVHALWEHLRAAEFAAVPTVLDVDDDGREVVQWVEGDAGVEPVSPEVASDHALSS